MQIIDKAILEKSNSITLWKENLSNIILKARYAFLKFSMLLILVYFIVFKSPIMWFLGDQLILRDMPQNSDAIIVLTGYGEAQYNNSSYQKRAIDALYYYKKKYSDFIIISSGRMQTLEDAKLIKMYLIDKGVEKKNILLSNNYPISTYDNIQLISKYVERFNIKSNILITAPYHSYRASLIWKKNFPELKLFVPEVYDTPRKKIRWGIGVQEMKVIIYEYLSLIYNFLLNRI